jgi:hypothetical protein
MTILISTRSARDQSTELAVLPARVTRNAGVAMNKPDKIALGRDFIQLPRQRPSLHGEHMGFASRTSDLGLVPGKRRSRELP